MSKLNIKLDINDELGKKVSDRLNRRNINLDSYLLELIITPPIKYSNIML